MRDITLVAHGFPYLKTGLFSFKSPLAENQTLKPIVAILDIMAQKVLTTPDGIAKLFHANRIAQIKMMEDNDMQRSRPIAPSPVWAEDEFHPMRSDNERKNELNLEYLLFDLVADKCIPHYDYESLMATSKHRRNREFLLNLDMYGRRCQEAFYEYLQTKGQHISLKHEPTIRTTSTAQHMSVFRRWGRDELRYMSAELTRRINAPVCAASLYAKDLLSDEQYEDVMAETTRPSRARKMMQVCMRAAGRPNFMFHFLDILEEYQPDLYVQVVSTVK